jgi:hypothetical protein
MPGDRFFMLSPLQPMPYLSSNFASRASNYVGEKGGTMRRFWKTFASAVIAGLLLSSAPTALTQQSAEPMKRPQTAMAPTRPPAPAAQGSSAAMAAAPQSRRVVIVEPIRVFDPFFDYPYPYAYPPDYMASNFGYVKIKTDHKDANVYVDGGFADKVEKAKKFALRPGTHEIELRDSDGRSLFRERVAVLVGKTTELHVG